MIFKGKFFRKKGFSLIELLISVFVVAILFSATTLIFSRTNAKRNMQFDARTIEAIFRDVQQRSITQEGGAIWGIRFYSNMNSYYELFKSDNPISGALYSVETAPPAVTVVSKFQLRSKVFFVDPAPDYIKDIVFSNITGIPTPLSVPGVFENQILLSNTYGGQADELVAVTDNGTVRN